MTRRLTARRLAATGLALGLLIPAAPGRAATILERTVELRLEGSSVVTREDLLVKLEEPGDLKLWDRFPLMVDDHIELLESSAEVLDAGGAVVEKVPRRKYEHVESPSGGLYDSSKALLVPFSSLEVGQLLRISSTTRGTPAYPADNVPLALETPQARLRVRVTGGAGELRWHLRGPEESFRVNERGGTLEVVAEGLDGYSAVERGPSAGSFAPKLFLAWGAGEGWTGIGSWYEGFRAAVPPGGEAVRALAAKLVAGRETPRERLEALTAYVKGKVRYEAVEIGHGGWRPSPSTEVLERGWGDCKDKSELLLELLKAAELPGHMALLRAGYGERIETAFATPFQFNHAIVAVPAAAVAGREDDPVSDGLLFIDPTSEHGAVTWLTPFSQGHHALVVDGGASRLVRTPVVPEREGRRLLIDGEVSPSGMLEARLHLTLSGAWALPWLRDLATRTTDRTIEDIQAVASSIAPGARVVSAGWEEGEGPVPAIVLQATIHLADAVRGEPGERWLRAKALGALPEPRILEDRTLPVVLSGSRHHTRWQLRLPEGWCPAKPAESVVENSVGKLSSRVASEDGTLVVQRELWIDDTWVEPERFAELRELALEESRAGRRRIRLRCE